MNKNIVFLERNKPKTEQKQFKSKTRQENGTKRKSKRSYLQEQMKERENQWRKEKTSGGKDIEETRQTGPAAGTRIKEKKKKDNKNKEKSYELKSTRKRRRGHSVWRQTE